MEMKQAKQYYFIFFPGALEFSEGCGGLQGVPGLLGIPPGCIFFGGLVLRRTLSAQGAAFSAFPIGGLLFWGFQPLVPVASKPPNQSEGS